MIIGIDLGTTNSLVAVWKDGKATLIPNSLGELITPSAVSVESDETILVGRVAKERIASHPERTAIEFKRYMGTDRVTHLGGRAFRAEELSSFVIRSLKEDAEAFLGEPVREAIITVPAYFNDTQRKATKIAGELAGLKVERLLNEPTAAALAYGLHTANEESRYLVFDLGGGTFDVSILELFDGVMEVHASAGDNHLGGSDFTGLLSKKFSSEKFPELYPQGDEVPEELDKILMIQSEKAKYSICDKGVGEIRIEWEGKSAALTVTASEFEAMAGPLLERISTPIRRALRDARLMVEDISEILLVGGATRMPVVRKLATRLFRRFPATGIHPDEVVALGAAVQAGLKMRDAALDDIVMTDVCPYTLGVEIVIGLSETNYQSGHFLPVIERNSYIPVSRVERLRTVIDQQEKIAVKIYQGENPLVEDNVYLGDLTVAVPRSPKGRENVDIRFTYDINGLLEVEVVVVSTGEKKAIVIEENPGAMSAEEIKKRFEALQELKIHPRDQMENKAVMARAERMFRELLGEQRTIIGEQIAVFEAILNRQDSREISQARQQFREFLDDVEGLYRF